MTVPPISRASAPASVKRCASGPGGTVAPRSRAARGGQAEECRPRPPGPHIASATRRATRAQLGGGALGVREVVDDERAERDVERAVGERQGLGVGVQELDLRVAAARLGQHARGEVGAGDRRPARGRGGGERPEPAADVEHRHARPDRAASSSGSIANAVARAISAS